MKSTEVQNPRRMTGTTLYPCAYTTTHARKFSAPLDDVTSSWLARFLGPTLARAVNYIVGVRGGSHFDPWVNIS